MIRTKIADALKSTDYNKEICIKGWVRTHRSSKAVDFIAVNDGSTIKNIQIVVDAGVVDAEVLKQVTTGACICVEGILVESPAQGQASEVHCKSLLVYICRNCYQHISFVPCSLHSWNAPESCHALSFVLIKRNSIRDITE